MTAAELKTVASLGKKKFRDETGLFVVEGEKMVSEALDSGLKISGRRIWKGFLRLPPLLLF